MALPKSSEASRPARIATSVRLGSSRRRFVAAVVAENHHRGALGHLPVRAIRSTAHNPDRAAAVVGCDHYTVTR